MRLYNYTMRTKNSIPQLCESRRILDNGIRIHCLVCIPVRAKYTDLASNSLNKMDLENVFSRMGLNPVVPFLFYLN